VIIIFPITFTNTIIIATLTLGSQPKQRLARVWAKREAREAHLIFPGV
jgi:hypothetical protein